MAFESNLPTGSVPFTNLMYKDPNGRIWAGSERNSEFYRFVDRSEIEFLYVNIKDFGAIGDGVTDDSGAFYDAVDEAKATGNYLYLPAGAYRVDIVGDTVEMNGCLGILGKGELLFDSNGDPDRPILWWYGEKTAAGTLSNVSRYQQSFTLSTGLDIKQGDTIFITSAELIVSDANTNYFKGGRFTVKSYNSATGVCATYEPSYYNITTAYAYWNNIRPKVEIDGVKIRHLTVGNKRGIEVSIGELYVSNSDIRGLGRCIISSSSLSRVLNSTLIADTTVSTSNGYAYNSAGLGDNIVMNCNIYGNRHGVACGDLGYWRENDVSLPGTAAIFLPSICRVAGCRVEGNALAFDSHGITTLLEAFNCDIYGGVQAGGVETYVSNCRIYDNPSLGTGIRIGRDRPSGSGIYHGRYAIKDCTVYCRRNFLAIWTDVEQLELSNVNVVVEQRPSLTEDMIRYVGSSKIRDFKISGISIESPLTNEVIFNFQANGDLNMNRVRSVGAGIRITPSTVGAETVTLSDVRVQYPLGRCIDIAGGDSATMTLNGTNVIMQGGTESMRLVGVRYATLQGGAQITNTEGITVNQSGICSIVLLGFRSVQSSGQRVRSLIGATELTLLGTAGLTNANLSGITLIGKYGNTSVGDRLKTSLTTSTTTKYGADSNGDLTLS